MIHMHVPKHIWSSDVLTPNVVLTACYLINRMSSSILNGASPHFILFARVFCCTCHTPNLGPRIDKLDPQARECVFLGYS